MFLQVNTAEGYLLFQFQRKHDPTVFALISAELGQRSCYQLVVQTKPCTVDIIISLFLSDLKRILNKQLPILKLVLIVNVCLARHYGY